MIGYHYTAKRNWLTIEHEGLVPYVLRKDIVSDGVPGVWLFRKRQSGRSHFGCVLFQMYTKMTTDVIELAVQFDPIWTVRDGWKILRDVRHTGQITRSDGELIAFYHVDEPAVISWRHIPAENIAIIGEYSIDECWTQQNDTATVQLLESATVRVVP